MGYLDFSGDIETAIAIRTMVLPDDTPGTGGNTLETATGQKAKLTVAGIEIDNGMGAKIAMQGPQVSVNSGALEVI